MRVEESNTHEYDFKLVDISEEEWDAMFLEGIREVVRLARKGEVDDYVVIPYEPKIEEVLGECKLKVEIDGDEADALVQIGAVSMIGARNE